MISSNYGQPSRLIARGAQHLPDKRSRTSTAHAAHDDEAANQLSAAESDAIEILAETPCASDAEFLEKLRFLVARETRIFGPPDGNHDFGSIVVAVDRHFNVDRDFSQPIVERRQDWERPSTTREAYRWDS
jgi:hypothetical protein